MLFVRLIQDILRSLGTPEKSIRHSLLCWLFNPFTITISTRGSSEAIVAVQILLMLKFLLQGGTALLAWHTAWLYASKFGLWHVGKDTAAASLLGISVHWRLFPIVYTLPVLLWLSRENKLDPKKQPRY